MLSAPETVIVAMGGAALLLFLTGFGRPGRR